MDRSQKSAQIIWRRVIRFVIGSAIVLLLGFLGLWDIIGQALQTMSVRAQGLTVIILVVTCVMLVYFLIRQRGETHRLTELQCDLTKAAADARASQARLQLVMDNIPVLIDATNEAGDIIFWNQECERVTGYSADEIVNNPDAWRLLYPDDDMREQLIKVMKDEKPLRNIEWVLTCKDGSQRIIAWTNISHSVRIPPWYGWGVGIDVTERVRAEAAKIDQARLQSALDVQRDLNTRLLNFTTLASHELRTPLTIISTAAQKIQRYQNRMSDEQQQENLRRIIANVIYIDHMLRDLSMSLGDTDDLNFNPAYFDLQRVVQSVIDDMRLISVDKHVFDINLPDATQQTYYGDETLIRYILWNLLSNAVKFSPDGGPISLTVTDDENALSMTIRDEGMGIADNDLKRIFEPYFRGGGTTGIAGTGLGLKIVSDAVKLHHGSIDVRSERGSGTVVTVRLPDVVNRG